MSPSLFALLEQVLLPNESLKFTLSRAPTGILVLLQPNLRKDTSEVPKEAEQARATLAMPLRLLGTPAQLDETFAAQLQGYGVARHELHDGYRTLMDALHEASKDTRAKTSNVGKSTVPKPKVPTHSAPAKASSETDAAADDATDTSKADASDGPSSPAPSAATPRQIDMIQQPMSLI